MTSQVFALLVREIGENGNIVDVFIRDQCVVCCVICIYSGILLTTYGLARVPVLATVLRPGYENSQSHTLNREYNIPGRELSGRKYVVWHRKAVSLVSHSTIMTNLPLHASAS